MKLFKSILNGEAHTHTDANVDGNSRSCRWSLATKRQHIGMHAHTYFEYTYCTRDAFVGKSSHVQNYAPSYIEFFQHKSIMCEIQYISPRCKTEEPYVAWLIKSNELLSTAVQKTATHNEGGGGGRRSDWERANNAHIHIDGEWWRWRKWRRHIHSTYYSREQQLEKSEETFSYWFTDARDTQILHFYE